MECARHSAAHARADENVGGADVTVGSVGDAEGTDVRVRRADKTDGSGRDKEGYFLFIFIFPTCIWHGECWVRIVDV